MEYILIAIGILAGIVVYLYLFSGIHSWEDKKKEGERKIEEIKSTEFEYKDSRRKGKISNGLKPRFCPLCGTELKPHESIYAEVYPGNPRPKVLIHGCKYCYNPSGMKIKKVDLSKYFMEGENEDNEKR